MGECLRGSFKLCKLSLLNASCCGVTATLRKVVEKFLSRQWPRPCLHVMGVFKLPFSVCDDLSKVIRNFWWGSEKGKRKTHWISWDKMVMPKRQGGIGFRDMRIFNQALLARQAWRLIQQPHSLCARVLKARYYPQGHILDTVFTGQPSLTWYAIAYGLELLKKGLIWRIGNGDSVRIWRDNWIPRNTALKPFGARARMRVIRVSELLHVHGAWNTSLIRRIFWPVDAEAILKIRTSPRYQPDFLAWNPECNGIFTVRSAYRLGWGKQRSS